MPEPIHLQDNLNKTLLAQQVADQLIEGAEKAHHRSHSLAQERIEDTYIRQQVGFDEERECVAIKSDEESKFKKRKQPGKRKKKRAKNGEKITEFPKRQEEDDWGKGKKIDLKG